MNAEEMAQEGFYLVKSVLRHRYRQGWRFLTLWEGFGVEEATWEPFSAFVLPEGRLNSVLVDYLSQNNLGEFRGSLRRLPPRLKLGTESYPYLPKRMCECAIPKVVRASRRSGVLILPKSARLLNLEGWLIDATGYAPGLPSPKRLISVLAQNLWGIPSVLIQVLFFPTYLSTTGRGGQKL